MRRSSFLVPVLAVALLVAAAPHAAADYLIEVQSGGPGTVSPPDAVVVPAGGSETFTFTPSGCYTVGEVTVDEVPVGTGITSYTFTNVQSDHLLYVPFVLPGSTTSLDVRPLQGQCAVPETLTAVVPGGDGGSVQFYRDGALLGTSPVSSGIARFVLASGLPSFSYTFSAGFLGTNCVGASDSPVIAYDVAETGPTPVTLALTLTPQQPELNTPVIAATTLRIDGAPAPQNGHVTYYDGATVLGTVTMASGQSSLSFEATTPGPHVITAVARLSSCPSVSVPSSAETLAAGLTHSSVTLSISPQPANAGQTVLLIAQVYPFTATGVIDFVDVTDGDNVLGTAQVHEHEGSASLEYGPVCGSDRTIEARYSGDAVYRGCTSNPATLVIDTVAPVSTSMVFSIEPRQVNPGEPVTMTVVVTPKCASGVVRFVDFASSTEVGSATFIGGVASFTYATPPGSSRTFQAYYDGDGTYAPCTGNPLYLQVGPSVPTTLADTYATDGTVDCVVSNGGTIYIGGEFSHVGRPTGPAVVIDAATGSVLEPFPQVIGDYVNCVAADGNGGWYLGGQFTMVRGQPRSNLAHVDAAGNVTAWNPGTNGIVTALAVSGGMVYPCGTFTTIGGQTRPFIAAVDAVTGAVTAWDAHASRPVYRIAASGGTLYVAGDFSVIGGQFRHRSAALDAVTGAATAWDPNASGIINAIAVSGSTVYAGGIFTNIGGQARAGIAALDAVTGAATPWNPGVPLPDSLDYMVRALAVGGGNVYVGGNFTSIGGEARNGLAAIDVASGVSTAWNPDPGYAQINSIVAQGGTIYVGGYLSAIGGVPRLNIAAIDAGTGLATAWNPGAGVSLHGYAAGVLALAVDGGKVFAGGDFSIAGGLPREHIAAIDATTGIPTSWNPGADAVVRAMVLDGGTLYAAGAFTRIGDQPRNCIAALDVSTGLATSWDPNTQLADYGRKASVNAIAVRGGTIYAGGAFTGIGGRARNNIAAIDAVTGLATDFDPNAQWTGTYTSLLEVDALAMDGAIVYAGGTFNTIGGRFRNGIAALDAMTGAATAWNPNASLSPTSYGPPQVRCLLVDGGRVVAGGTFTGIGGQARPYLAALDVTTGAATPWDAAANRPVQALVRDGSRIYVGGDFWSIGFQPRAGLASLDATTGVATTWNPRANGGVNAIALGDHALYVGGWFSAMGDQPQPHFAAIVTDATVATLLARFDAEPSAEGVALRWSFGDPDRVASVAVERARTAAGPWLAITPERRDEDGVTVAIDPTADAGTYAYRLNVQLTDGSRQVFGPVSASAAVPMRSELSSLAPNPARDGTQMHYSVAHAGRVRLEVLDVQGRVAATLVDGAQAPGRYVVRWDGSGARGRIAPGLYFVRFAAPGIEATRRLAIVR